MGKTRWMVAIGVLVIFTAGLPGLAAEAATAAGPTEAGSSDWRMVSAGGNHTCGIRTTGRLYCWGNDANGQLGDNPALTQQPTPVQVAGNHTDWTTVTAGSLHTCARRATGRLYCWGSDTKGQLGDNPALTPQPTPVQVAGNHTDWTTVTAGGDHTCARRATGRLYCWGYDTYGQLGNNPAPIDQPTPVQVAGNHTDRTTGTAGGHHTCARRATGRLYCWGYDTYGQLGNNPAPIDQPTPVQVAGNHTDWTTVTAGGNHTCARRATGRLYCWGFDFFGQLGDNPTLGNQPTPTQVEGGATDWRQVTAGGGHTCARITTGRLYCWGSDSNGQLGDNPALTPQPTPVNVAA